MQEYYAEKKKKKQLKDMQTAVAMQLGEIAHMLRQSARETRKYQPLSEGMMKKLRKMAYRHGLMVGEAWSMEKDNRRLEFFLTLRARNHKTKPVKEAQEILENLTGRHLMSDKHQKMFIGEEYELFCFSETVR